VPRDGAPARLRPAGIVQPTSTRLGLRRINRLRGGPGNAARRTHDISGGRQLAGRWALGWLAACRLSLRRRSGQTSRPGWCRTRCHQGAVPGQRRGHAPGRTQGRESRPPACPARRQAWRCTGHSQSLHDAVTLRGYCCAAERDWPCTPPACSH
jgi:hypothetical protein